MDAFMDFLERNRSKKITTVTPGGNHGDTLIHMGMIKKLNEKNIDFFSLNLEKEYKNKPYIGFKFLFNIALWKVGSSRGFKLVNIPKDTDLILFEGGGYMNDFWYGPEFVHQIIKRNDKPVAIAPQSYLFSETSIDKIFGKRKNITLFCRERYSQKHLEDLIDSEKINVKLSKDTALYLDEKDLENFIQPYTEEYELVAFRQDRESLISRDIQNKFLKKCSNPYKKDVSMIKKFDDFISLVANAGDIFTDRLHVKILGKIMDKKTTLYPNKYHKNLGVWEYSLKDSINYAQVDIREF
jgi:exopolysaccharide biosynthesis predicted pyruvyltransferase EpsI